MQGLSGHLSGLRGKGCLKPLLDLFDPVIVRFFDSCEGLSPLGFVLEVLGDLGIRGGATLAQGHKCGISASSQDNGAREGAPELVSSLGSKLERTCAGSKRGKSVSRKGLPESRSGCLESRKAGFVVNRAGAGCQPLGLEGQAGVVKARKRCRNCDKIANLNKYNQSRGVEGPGLEGKPKPNTRQNPLGGLYASIGVALSDKGKDAQAELAWVLSRSYGCIEV